MKLLKKLRHGAYFVDVLLLIAAGLAIIGLATFVHLKNGKSPEQAGLRGSLSIETSHMESLGLAAGDDQTPSTDSPVESPAQQAGSASANLQAAAPAPEITSPASACRNNDCDSTRIEITPEIKLHAVPITVEPVRLPTKPCGGLIKRVAASLLKNTDPINCPT